MIPKWNELKGNTEEEILPLSKGRNEGQSNLPKEGEPALCLEDNKHATVINGQKGGIPPTSVAQAKAQKHSLLEYGK